MTLHFLGFPAADSVVRDFLRQNRSYKGSLRDAYMFLIALFEVAAKRFGEISSAKSPSSTLAEAFRRQMNIPNERQKFYSKVIEQAKVGCSPSLLFVTSTELNLGK